MTRNVNKNVTERLQNVTKRSHNECCQNDLVSVRVADPGVVGRAAHAAGHVDLLRLKVELGVFDVDVPENRAIYDFALFFMARDWIHFQELSYKVNKY